MNNKKIIASLSYLGLMFVLIIAVVFVYASNTLGWFASNKEVASNGLNITTNAPFDTEQYFLDKDGNRITSGAVSIFSDLRPGDCVEITLCIENKEDKDMSVNLWMSAPSPDTDSVYIDAEAGLYHYFGTQIRITDIETGGSSFLTAAGTAAYLLKLDDSLYRDSMPPTALESPLDFSDYANRRISSSISLPKGETVTVTLSFEFTDNGETQNAYADFGKADTDKADLVLLRTLICEYNYTE